MTWRSARFAGTAVLLALASLAVPSLYNSPRAAAAVKKDIAVTLKISDKASGFKLEATKQVAADSSAFNFLRHTFAVTYKTDVDGGPIVTGLCGVTPAKAQGWVCTIDEKPCKNIGSVSITKDMTIEWKTEKAVAGTEREPEDEALIQGTWIVVAGERDGKETKDFNGIKWTFGPRGQNSTQRNNDTQSGSFKLDTAIQPRGIDIDPFDEPESVIGIYELKGDGLKLCITRPTKYPRPTDFTTKPDSGRLLLTLKRQK